MITPQFTYDKTGNKVGVFLAIEDWNQLKDLPEVEELSVSNFSIPEWQMELGIKELENIAENRTELLEWGEAKKQFKP